MKQQSSSHLVAFEIFKHSPYGFRRYAFTVVFNASRRTGSNTSAWR